MNARDSLGHYTIVASSLEMNLLRKGGFCLSFAITTQPAWSQMLLFMSFLVKLIFPNSDFLSMSGWILQKQCKQHGVLSLSS